MAFQALEAFKAQHEGKSFKLSHCWRINKDEEKFKLQYVALKAHADDKKDVASIALIAIVEGMMTNKDSREEKQSQDKEEKMNAFFMEMQRRRLEMEAEKQVGMLEMEAEKQAKMLEIEAANAETKAKEVALASTMVGVKIMKLDLNTVTPRKRPWFDKIQNDMVKFDDE
ncbi:C2 domain-containing protein [Hordeum vulgare]|nr:C2 domain-containing protein [Hordeum vulgare]